MPPRATRNESNIANQAVYNPIGKSNANNARYTAIRPPSKHPKTADEISALQLKLIQSYLTQVKTQDLSVSSVELELKFGTRNTPITQIQSLNVISFLHSRGFIAQEMEYLLRINCDISQDHSIRAEIKSLNSIQDYCRTSTLNKDKDSVKYITKSGNTQLGFYNIYVEDLNYRMSLNDENIPPPDDITQLHTDWKKISKHYRLIHRTTMKHPGLPYIIDISIIKQSKQDTRDLIDLFKTYEQYEVEIECDNNKFSDVDFKSADILIDLTRIVKYIQSGIQNTNYPIKLSEQHNVLNAYSELSNGPSSRLQQPRFIGPQSVSLELKNVSSEIVVGTPNIHDNYCVTDKADGERKLMYINEVGKIYLININFEIQYTGLYTKDTNSYNSILDGEHILLDKKGKFINWFSAFDIYFINNKNIRDLDFETIVTTTNPGEFRLPMLEKFIESLKPQLFTASNNKDSLKIKFKKFIVGKSSTTNTIFEGCDQIWNKSQHNTNLIPYNIDGLIFTPINAPVPKTKTWNESLKWKPANMNSIDFMVTVKQSNGIDDIKIKYLNGNISADNIIRYKMIQLRVGYSSADHDNDPQQMVNDGRFRIGNNNNNDKVNDYKPVQFFPTSPPDNEAGICHIAINRRDDKMYTENGEVIETNTIVEFRYDNSNAGIDKPFRWIPMRVRYDKTKKLRRGEPMYGNDFTVANNIWNIIHNPITDDMITTGNNISSIDNDIYYNTNYSKNTVNLRHFHNRFVKQSLIQSVSRENDTLSDLAVGKGGDIPKWIDSKLKFVFGIDLSHDNIHNKKDGACVRFINSHKTSSRVPDALFVVGNSGIDLSSKSNTISNTDRITIDAIFGKIRDTDTLPAVVKRNSGIAQNGFNICSVQFALHYMFESELILDSFLKNVSFVTKLGGFFIGTCWDGVAIFNELKDLKKGDMYKISTETQSNHDNAVLCQITKQYSSNVFGNDMTSIGMPVDIKQDSINNIREYLVNFKLFIQLMSIYGFELAEQTDLNRYSKLNHTSGMFKEMYDIFEQNRGLPMSPAEKKISFLNRYFIFKKVRESPGASILSKTSNTSKQFIENTIPSIPITNRVTIENIVSNPTSVFSVDISKQPTQPTQHTQPIPEIQVHSIPSNPIKISVKRKTTLKKKT